MGAVLLLELLTFLCCYFLCEQAPRESSTYRAADGGDDERAGHLRGRCFDFPEGYRPLDEASSTGKRPYH